MGHQRRVRVASHLAAFIAGAATAVALVSEARDSGDANNRYRTLDAFAHSLSLIRRHHVDSVSERQLVYGSIDGMVEKLDKHSSFYPPRRYQRLREDTHGEFGGVGMLLKKSPPKSDPPFPVVDSVIVGSPADRAGVVAGQELLAIDGQPTAARGQKKRRGRSFHTVLRGPAKSKVVLLLRSGGKSRTVELVREHVKVPSVEAWAFGDGIAYARIRRFQEATSRDLTVALDRLGGKKLRGVVLDVRNNPGGLFDQAVVVSDLFLDKGIVVQVTGRRDIVLERPEAKAGSRYEKVALAMIVDENTASAAEIVAGALKDHGRAALFGKRTFGKGSVQTFYDLPDGAGLKLTTARYVSPAGTVIHGTGIEPNHDVEAFAGDSFVVGGSDQADDPGAGLRKKWPHLSRELSERLEADFQLHEAYSSLLTAKTGDRK